MNSEFEGGKLMKSNALKINENDNVVVATELIDKGSVVIVDGEQLFKAVEDIQPAHKIALVPIASGDKVIRYNEPIVEATEDIDQGAWVHVHNTQPIPSES